MLDSCVFNIDGYNGIFDRLCYTMIIYIISIN